jgi:hypothetical protein
MVTPKIRLNQPAVDRLSAPDPSGKQKIHWDRGFGVRCSGKTNGKSYVVQHDLPNGRARRITVGSANIFTIAEAKERAEKLLSLFYNGVDPKAANGSVSAVGRRDSTLKNQSSLSAARKCVREPLAVRSA